MMAPKNIAVSRSKGITLDWPDGQQVILPVDFLRDRCPCATCTGAHGTPPRSDTLAAERSDPFRMYTPALRILEVEPVGNYALRIAWSDGHSTGIYSWETLRHLSEEASSPKAQ